MKSILEEGHLVTVNISRSVVVLHRVDVSGNRILYTEVELMRASPSGGYKLRSMDDVARDIGEALILDAPALRTLLIP